jgi:tRNA threonylcarbamoyladenosine biosynthesis protein TsaE
LWLRSLSPEATREAGRLLGAAIAREGALVSLEGPLGAGKTVFAKGVAEGLGVDPGALASPTFVIAHEYAAPGGRALVHVDCYRVAGASELESAGLLDWLAPGAVVLVEWGDRFPDALPPDRLRVVLARTPGEDSRRELSAVGSGPAAEALLARWSVGLRQRGAARGLEVSERAPRS